MIFFLIVRLPQCPQRRIFKKKTSFDFYNNLIFEKNVSLLREPRIIFDYRH